MSESQDGTAVYDGSEDTQYSVEGESGSDDPGTTPGFWSVKRPKIGGGARAPSPRPHSVGESLLSQRVETSLSSTGKRERSTLVTRRSDGGC